MVTKPRRIEYVELDAIERALDNPRDHEVEDIAASIERWGFTDAPVHDGRTGRIIAGHGRLEALEWLRDHDRPLPEGLISGPRRAWRVPVQYGWSSANDAEAEGMLIALNRLTEAARWRTPGLTSMLERVNATPEGLKGVGYSQQTFAEMLAHVGGGGFPAAGPSTYRPKTKPRRDPALGSVQLLAGDCIERMAELPANSVDAIVSDPPYSFEFMSRAWDAHSGYDDDPAFGYYLAGLIDGEGCFRVQRHERGTHSCTFTMKLRADDRTILDRAQRWLKAGTISDVPSDGSNHPQVRWAVQDKEGCQRLVDVLDKYPLRAKKAVDYMTWREAVCEWTDRPRGNRWHGPADQTRAAALKERIEATREFTDTPWSGNGYQDWTRLWAREAYRVLKPGGHLLAFGGTRTYHRMASGIEDAGFEVRDSIQWLYGQGFPKSMNVSKAVDRELGAERTEVIGSDRNWGAPSPSTPNAPNGTWDITAPATEQGQAWDGWGTALKPSHEPIIVARKPVEGSVARNVLEHGTGALNIDATRVAFAGPDDQAETKAKNQHATWGSAPPSSDTFNPGLGSREDYDEAGRWPPNVLLDPAAAAELDQQSGTSSSPAGMVRGQSRSGGIMGTFDGYHESMTGYGDEGGASRYFPIFRYEPKASTAERNAGLDALPVRTPGELTDRTDGSAGLNSPRAGAGRDTPQQNIHPTVKPLELMRWLVRLVCRDGGTVLDPFAGSGTTLVAGLLEGCDVIGCEMTADYLPIIEARVQWAQQQRPEEPTDGQVTA